MRNEKGSVTLEAALVVPIIFIIILGIIYSTFYLHDSVVIKSICNYYCGKIQREELTTSEVCAAILKESSGKLYLIKEIGVDVDKENDSIVEVSGRVNGPFKEIIKMLGYDSISVSCKKKSKVNKDDIYKRNLVKDIVEDVMN